MAKLRTDYKQQEQYLLRMSSDKAFLSDLSRVFPYIQDINTGHLNEEEVATELKALYLKGIARIQGHVTDRKGFGPCDCTHPPSFGHCIFGACVSVFRTGLRITINI